MMNVVFTLRAKGAFSDFKEGVNSNSLSLSPLACSRFPPSFHKNTVSDLWLITCTISRKIRETASFYRQLRYLHFFYFCIKCSTRISQAATVRTIP